MAWRKAHGLNISKENYERIFGSEAERLERVRKFKEEKKKQKPKPRCENNTQRAWAKNYYDYGLGEQVRDYEHRKELMAKMNLHERG